MIKLNENKFEINELVKNEFDVILNKFINFGLNKGYIPLFDNIKILNEYIFKGYSTQLKNNKNMNEYYLNLCEWCNKKLNRNTVKEYIIELLGKPKYYNDWKLD
jgi:hypothetical protein